MDIEKKKVNVEDIELTQDANSVEFRGYIEQLRDECRTLRNKLNAANGYGEYQSRERAKLQQAIEVIGKTISLVCMQ